MSVEPPILTEKDHPFIWSPECYDVCRICGGPPKGHPKPRSLEWEVVEDAE